MKIFRNLWKAAEIVKTPVRSSPAVKSNGTRLNLTYIHDGNDRNDTIPLPISTRMPLSGKSYGSEEILSWVANLLPEGPQINTIARMIGVSQSDPLAILAEIGCDTAGAFSFSKQGGKSICIRPIGNEADLERLIEEMPQEPFLAGTESVSMCLSGTQPKIGVHLDNNGEIYIPINGGPSTWILKPDVPGLPGGVYNEALCMRLAALVGVHAPEVRVGRAGARKYLLVKRYDRQLRKYECHRLHQEDMCQVLGRLPEAKYEQNDTGQCGPTIRDMIDVMRTLDPGRGVNLLLDQVIFNTITCNTDAHAKNYSIMIAADGIRTAPIYDVMCAKLWSDVTQKQAMSLATKRHGDYFKGRHWQREAALSGLNPDLILKQVEDLCRETLAMLPQAMEDVAIMDASAGNIVKEVGKYITERAGFLLNGLAEQDPDPVAWAHKHLESKTGIDSNSDRTDLSGSQS